MLRCTERRVATWISAVLLAVFATMQVHAFEIEIEEVNPNNILITTLRIGGDESETYGSENVTSEVFVFDSFGHLYFVDPDTMAELWSSSESYDFTEVSIEDIVVRARSDAGNPVVVLVSPDGERISCYHAILGTLLWEIGRTQLDRQRITTNISLRDDGRMVYAGLDSGRLLEVDVQRSVAARQPLFRISEEGVEAGSIRRVDAYEFVAVSVADGRIQLFDTVRLKRANHIDTGAAGTRPVVRRAGGYSYLAYCTEAPSTTTLELYTVRAEGDGYKITRITEKLSERRFDGDLKTAPIKYKNNGLAVLIDAPGAYNELYLFALTQSGVEPEAFLEGVIRIRKSLMRGDARIYGKSYARDTGQYGDLFVVDSDTIREIDVSFQVGRGDFSGMEMQELTIENATDTSEVSFRSYTVAELVDQEVVSPTKSYVFSGIVQLPSVDRTRFYAQLAEYGPDPFYKTLVRLPDVFEAAALEREAPSVAAFRHGSIFEFLPVAVEGRSGPLWSFVDQENVCYELDLRLGDRFSAEADALLERTGQVIQGFEAVGSRAVMLEKTRLTVYDASTRRSYHIEDLLPTYITFWPVFTAAGPYAFGYSVQNKIYAVRTDRSRRSYEQIIPRDVFQRAAEVIALHAFETAEYVYLTVTGRSGIITYRVPLDMAGSSSAIREVWRTSVNVAFTPAAFSSPPGSRAEEHLLYVPTGEGELRVYDVIGMENGDDGTAAEQDDLLSGFDVVATVDLRGELVAPPLVTRLFVVLPVGREIDLVWRTSGELAETVGLTDTATEHISFSERDDILCVVDHANRVSFVKASAGTQQLRYRFNIRQPASTAPFAYTLQRGADGSVPVIMVQTQDGELFLFNAEVVAQ